MVLGMSPLAWGNTVINIAQRLHINCSVETFFFIIYRKDQLQVIPQTRRTFVMLIINIMDSIVFESSNLTLSMHLCLYIYYLTMSVYIYVSIYISLLPAYLSVYLFIYLSIWIQVYPVMNTIRYLNRKQLNNIITANIIHGSQYLTHKKNIYLLRTHQLPAA